MRIVRQTEVFALGEFAKYLHDLIGDVSAADIVDECVGVIASMAAASEAVQGSEGAVM